MDSSRQSEDLQIQPSIALTWKMKNTSEFFERQHSRMSPYFTWCDSLWALKLEISGSFVHASLIKHSTSFKAHSGSIDYKIAVKDVIGGEHFLFESKADLNINASHYPGADLVYTKDLQRRQTEFYPDDVLTIVCELKSSLVITAEEYTNAMPSIAVMEVDDITKDMEALLQSQANTDIVLQVDTEAFPTHRSILGARSSVFAAMFTHDFQESSNNVVTISDILPAVMKDLLQYIYTGKVKEFSTEKAFGLYPASDKYDMKGLKNKCRDILLGSFTVDNVCEIAIMADMHNDGKLLDAIKAFIHENLNSVLSTKSWSELINGKPRLASEILRAVTTQITTR